MSIARRRTAALATVLALSGLAGVALESNHGIQQAASRPVAAAGSSSPIVTSTSGAATISSTPVSRTGAPATAPRLVTRASGAPAFDEREDE